jgi:hypothetical protein
MKHLLFLFLLLLVFGASAQSISTADMLQMAKCTDTTCVGKIAHNNGFSNGGKLANDTAEVFTWDRIKKTTEDFMLDMVIYQRSKQFTSVDFMTTNKTSAEELKDNFLKMGYTFSHMIEDESNHYYYQSPYGKSTFWYMVPNMIYDFIYHCTITVKNE